MNRNPKKITITEVAKKAGVSKGTVSAVINNRSTVKFSTREHVLKIMRDMHFRPRGQARSLKSKGDDNSIGLIIRELDNPFYMAVAKGVKKYANSKDYIVFISSSESRHDDEENLSRFFAAKDVKGAIIAPVINGNIEIDHLFRLKMLNYPFVMLEAVQGIQCNVVSINNIEATKMATRHLIEIGHKRIVHFSGPEFACHTHDRIQGFRDAFSESELIYHPDLIVTCGSHFRDGYETAVAYFKDFKADDFPMAVVCYNDVVAMGLISGLHKLAIKVPEQVSVIGNDDIEFAGHWSPALTTISTPLTELGEKAAEILIRNIESDHEFPLENVILDAKLVVRDTTQKLT